MTVRNRIVVPGHATLFMPQDGLPNDRMLNYWLSKAGGGVGLIITQACFGSPEEVRDYLIDLADSLGTNTLLLNFKQGALPHDLFVDNLERFGKEVLPALQAHQVTTVPVG